MGQDTCARCRQPKPTTDPSGVRCYVIVHVDDAQAPASKGCVIQGIGDVLFSLSDAKDYATNDRSQPAMVYERMVRGPMPCNCQDDCRFIDSDDECILQNSITGVTGAVCLLLLDHDADDRIECILAAHADGCNFTPEE